MTRSVWSFAVAGTTIFGERSIDRLSEILETEKWRRILIVSDQMLESLGVVDQVAQALGTDRVERFLFSQPEPPVRAAIGAHAFAADVRPDAILGLGGGSAIDLAKIAANLVANGGRPEEYFGFGRIPGPTLPVIAVPTTAGTGSEVSHSAVLTDDAGAMKVSTLSPHLRPRWAVVDPELTYSCPPRLTAETGLDALTHAVEAFLVRPYDELAGGRETSRAYQGKAPITDALARDAIRKIFRHLPHAIADGADVVARRETALAALLAGMAFSNAGVSLVHALEYPLGGAGLCSHGLGNGLLLPYVIAAQRDVRRTELAELGRLIGVAGLSEDEDAAAEKFVRALFDLQASSGIPTRLREIGAREENLSEYARKAAAIDRLTELAPIDATENSLVEILRAAY